jgi:hypothetical protein
MKAIEFKKIIREEVRKVLRENTLLMKDPSVSQKVMQIIKMLMEIDVDDQTMEFILKQVGMAERMQRKLTSGEN